MGLCLAAALGMVPEPQVPLRSTFVVGTTPWAAAGGMSLLSGRETIIMAEQSFDGVTLLPMIKYCSMIMAMKVEHKIRIRIELTLQF